MYAEIDILNFISRAPKNIEDIFVIRLISTQDLAIFNI
jgi:hypothetical protein